jgi:hypothetical protein
MKMKAYCCSLEYSDDERHCKKCGEPLRYGYEGTYELEYETYIDASEIITNKGATPEQVQNFRQKWGTLSIIFDMKDDTILKINGMKVALSSDKDVTSPEPKDK